MLEYGYKPYNILALTFTNKAAREMKERIFQLVGNKAERIWAGTFHSIFLRVLRIEGRVMGFNENFTVYDAYDAKSLIKSIIKELQLCEKTYKPANIYARISNAKNHLIFPDAYAANSQIIKADADAKVQSY